MGFSTYLTHIDNFFSQSFSRILYVKVLLLPCYLFVFYHLLTDKTARKILHNHTTVIMLLLNFISLTVDLPLIISYNRQAAYIPFTPALCLTHQVVNYRIRYGAITSHWHFFLCMHRYFNFFNYFSLSM